MKIEEFLQSSYSAFHATANCERILKENGFEKLSFNEKWQIKPNGKYYITKNQSSIIAFKIGDLSEYFFNIAAAHTDSPCLKVKGNKLISSSQGKRINVEVYGGLLRYSYFDMPLKIAGRLTLKDGDKIVNRLYESDFNVVIPSLAIHQNREVNDNCKFEVQNDMLPLLGEAEDLYSALKLKDVLDADLFIVPDVKPYVSGANNEFISSPRLDNLTSAYSVIQSLCSCEPKGISIACCFDNEEIGNRTKQGANSSLLYSVLKLINLSLGHDDFDFYGACERGLILSIDNAHATHPAHPERSDIAETVMLNGGIVVKHNVTYSTDSFTAGIFKNLLDKYSIKYQDFYCNSNMRCGGTLGLDASSLLQMNSVDIGIAQLAMHSSVEMMGLSDIKTMEEGCRVFFENRLNLDD